MYPRDEERVGIVLNSVFKVVAAVFDGQIYEPLDKLNVLQMVRIPCLILFLYETYLTVFFQNLLTDLFFEVTLLLFV